MICRALLLICILVTAAAQVAQGAVSQWFPLAMGNKWEYSVREIGVMSISDGEHSQSLNTEAEGTCVEEVLSLKETRSDGVVFEHRSTTKMQDSETSESHDSTIDSLMLSSKKGVFVLASKSSGTSGVLSGKWESYNPPLMIYGAEMKSGGKWNMGTVREDKLRMPMVARVAGRETITVPAGTFEDCFKVYILCNKVSGTMGEGEDQAEISDGRSVTTVWVYPGVGTVKEDTLLQAKMSFPPDEEGRVYTMTGTQRKTEELQPGYIVDSE